MKYDSIPYNREHNDRSFYLKLPVVMLPILRYDFHGGRQLLSVNAARQVFCQVDN